MKQQKPNPKCRQLKLREGQYFENLLKQQKLQYTLSTLQRNIKMIERLIEQDKETLLQALGCIQENQTINLHANHCAMGDKFLIYIKEIGFPNLKILSLYSSNLTSLQTLSHMRMPQLQQLWASYNSIMSLQPLRKANLPALQILKIDENKVNEFPLANSVNFPKLNLVMIEYYFSSSETMLENLSFIFKLNTCHLSQISAKRRTRIHQHSLTQKLGQIWREVILDK